MYTPTDPFFAFILTAMIQILGNKMILEARNLSCQRGGIEVLRVEKFAVCEGETVAVIGPNGAGKCTLLLTLAQLLNPVCGDIFFKGERVSTGDSLALRRKIALVLQDPLLVNASVFDNVALGLRFRHISRVEITRRVDQWLSRLGVAHLRDRRARQLSGGEAQRVSLARALALEPEVLLLDEPFGALDAPTRARMLDDFQALVSELALTMVFVTHDLDEALFLGDQVAVILNGELRQQGPPEEIFTAPADLDVAAFVGVETVIPGRVVGMQDGHVTVDVGDVQMEAIGEAKVGQPVYMCLRPEDLTLWHCEDLPTSSARNLIKGTVSRLMTQGPLVRVVIDCGFSVVALVTRTSVQKLDLVVGREIAATFKASTVHMIPRSE